MPTASETAPPGRAVTISPTSRCSIARLTGVMCRFANVAVDVLIAK